MIRWGGAGNADGGWLPVSCFSLQFKAAVHVLCSQVRMLWYSGKRIDGEYIGEGEGSGAAESAAGRLKEDSYCCHRHSCMMLCSIVCAWRQRAFCLNIL